jgi:hypothetical protein
MKEFSLLLSSAKGPTQSDFIDTDVAFAEAS